MVHTKHHRDELTKLLGKPGESKFSDDLIERIRDVLDTLNRKEPVEETC